MSPTTWRGQAAMRISVTNWSTDEADVDTSVAAILRHLAEDLVHLVVLIGRYVEERAALLAGIARRTRIWADQKHVGFRHRLVDRAR